MFSKTVTLATNSYHYFPSTSQEDSSKDLGIWPVNRQRFITKLMISLIKDYYKKSMLTLKVWSVYLMRLWEIEIL